MRRSRYKTRYYTGDLAEMLGIHRTTAWRILTRSGLGAREPGTNRWFTTKSRIMGFFPDLLGDLRWK